MWKGWWKMSKTLREAMGLRDSIGDIEVGTTVRIKSSGHIGRVMGIGRHGLLDIQGTWGVYSPSEVEIKEESICLKI